MSTLGKGRNTHDRCLVCGSSRLAALSGYERAHLMRCRDCSMVFAARIPSDEDLEINYRDYGHAWHDSPITRRRYQELLAGFESHRSTNRILDFGCGAGFFLEEARGAGWDTYGTEYSGLALDLARSKQLEVRAAPIDIDTFPAGFFDVVTAFEVFEHLRDPKAEAELIARFLRPGGLLYCTTPNFNSLSRRLFGSRWTVIEYPEHLCYFTAGTLRRWLEGHGFDAQMIRSTGVSLARIRDSQRDGAPQPSHQAEEQTRARIERSSILRLAKALVNRTLSAARSGDTLKGSFRRRGR